MAVCTGWLRLRPNREREYMRHYVATALVGASCCVYMSVTDALCRIDYIMRKEYHVKIMTLNNTDQFCQREWDTIPANYFKKLEEGYSTQLT